MNKSLEYGQGYSELGLDDEARAELSNVPRSDPDFSEAWNALGWLSNRCQISEQDKTIIGDAYPDFTYGFNSELSYKSWTLSFNLFGSVGAQLINLNQWLIGSMNTNGNFNLSQDAYDNRWTAPGSSR